MKLTPFFILLLQTFLLTAPASAEIIGVETFDYPDGAIAGKTGGTFWDYKNTTPGPGHLGAGAVADWDNVTNAPTVSASRLSTSNSSAKREFIGPASAEGSGAVTDGADRANQVLYIRTTFTTGATLSNAIGLSTYDFGTERIFFGKPFNEANFGIATANGFGSATSSITVAANTTYTIVAKVDYPNDSLSLFINPDLNAAEPAPHAVKTGYTTNNFSTAVRLASSPGDPVLWDNLVVATTWADLGTVVTTLADEDDGSLSPTAGTGVSLREAVKYSPSGTLVTFASALDGGTILFTGGNMDVQGALTIDAGNLPRGLTLDADRRSRHFYNESGQALALTGLTLINGNGTGTNDPLGGAILSLAGPLRLTHCTLLENSATSGGAIYTQGDRCRLDHCTLSGNRSTDTSSTGGILCIIGELSLTHCTISGNTGNGLGGGVAWQNPATVVIERCIIAGNNDPASSRPDLFKNINATAPTATGPSLIGVNTLVESTFPTGALAGTAAAPLDPKLSPLGYFGGPTQTMHPLIGSPAIDAGGTVNPGGTDQRGFPSFVDGDNSGTAALDIGAVEAGPLFTVISGGDGLPPTLRTQLDNAATSAPGSRIGFSPSFSNATITLNGTELSIPATASLFIDASDLSGPVTISGNNRSRVFNILSGATVAMNNLVLTGGLTGAGVGGGGILNDGRLSLHFSTVSNNRTGNASSGNGGNGGGIFSSGPLDITRSTISNNQTGNGGLSGSQAEIGGSGGSGGGIFSSSQLAISHSTIANNRTGEGRLSARGGDGGGINSLGSLNMVHSTVAGNQTGSGGSPIGNGGGIAGSVNSPLVLQSSILAQNAGSIGQDIAGGGVIYLGTSFIGVTAGSTSTSGPAPLTGNARLAPLGDYGGPTQTMALLPGSPARNATRNSEVQQVSIGAFAINFTLTFNGATTSQLNENSSAAAVQSALTGLSTIGTGNVAVSLAIDGGNNKRYAVSFQGAFIGVDVPQISSATATITTLQNGFTSTATRDQRGFPIVGIPDIGAYEAGTLETNFNAFIWETLPTTATAQQHEPFADYDSDGADNFNEWTAGTVVTDPLSLFRVTDTIRSGFNFSTTFTSVANRVYTFETSEDLITWSPLLESNLTPTLRIGTGSPITLQLAVGPFPKFFLRTRVARP